MTRDETCGIVQDLLALYVDGVAGPQSVALVETHLAECPDCAALCEKMRSEAAAPPAVDEGEASVRHAWKLLIRSLRHRRLRTAIISVLVALALFAGGNLLYDHHFRVAREPIPHEALALSLTRRTDGQVLARLTYEGGRPVPRTSMSHFVEEGVLYFQGFRPRLERASSAEQMIAHWDYGLTLKDGALMLKGAIVREVRVGWLDGYHTVYRQGDDIPLFAP